MSHLSWFGLVVFLLSILAASVLTSTSNKPVRKGLERFHIKKIAWVILMVGVMYLYLSIPFVSRYYGFHQQREFPQNLDADSTKIVVIRDHQLRIENLESELKETKEELLELGEHYQLILQLGMYLVLGYGSSRIFAKEKYESEDATLSLDLDDK